MNTSDDVLWKCVLADVIDIRLSSRVTLGRVIYREIDMGDTYTHVAASAVIPSASFPPPCSLTAEVID